MSQLAMVQNRGGHQLPWLTVLAVTVASGLWLSLEPVPEALIFDRSAIAGGEWWRLLSGHWVHSDGRHALWDIAALALVGGLVESSGRSRLALAAVVGSLSVAAAIWWQLPELERYCGLSGMLNSLFVIALGDLWQRGRQPVVLAAAVLLGAKLLAELAAGQSVLIDPLWPGVPLAHLAGLLGGLAFLGGERVYRHQRNHRFSRDDTPVHSTKP
jgi:rhomboid family GlyGly-CTERM serine protease